MIFPLRPRALCLLLILAPVFLGGGAPVYADSAGNGAGGDGSAPGGTCWIIPIRGDIVPSVVTFVRREARKALAEKADYLVFEIDTFGGRVDSALQITSFITSIRDAKTVAWVHSSEASMGVSWSAGALIAFSCGEIYMASGTSMGAAAPVTPGTGGSMESAGEKTVSAVRSQMAALAERNGHPVGIALAMVDYDVDLWEVSVDGRIEALTREELERLEGDPNRQVERISELSPPGKLLSLTAGEAHRLGLAGLAGDQGVLLSALGAKAAIGESAPGFADGIIAFLTSGIVQIILIVIGIVMIFLEINTPGFGLPGTAALIAFILVFGSSALLGRAGSLELILFLAGAGLLAVEIFVLPGFGIAGISGLILVGLSLVLSMQDFVIPRFEWEWNLLGRNVVVVVIGIIAAITGIALIALMGPKIRIFDGLTLKTRIVGTAGGPDPDAALSGVEDAADRPPAANGGAPVSGEDGYTALTGKTGVAATTLRPSGKAEIGGEFFTVEADGLFIEAGSEVKVIRVYGNRIIVRPV
ncbi:MAG: nodulation protein NfeD [Treponema sp.]|jgi:membrane-bound serine protease (ClpP class)|nr:nodulation protein NfeD [Treponema sp.]